MKTEKEKYKLVNYAELQNKIEEHYERMCDDNYMIDKYHNKFEYLWIYIKDTTLEYYLCSDKDIMNKKRSENEFAFIRLWLDDVETENEIYYSVDSNEAFRICKENIEKIFNK
jgi:phosphoenolpyruvate synthase/pyruvate phosphate dikinase